MAKFVTFGILLVGLLVVLALGGVNTSSHELFNFLSSGSFSSIDAFINNITNMSGGGWVTAIAAFLALAAAGGIIIGLFTKQSTESIFIAGFAASILTIGVADLISVVAYMRNVCPAGSDCAWAGYLVFSIFLGLLIGFTLSVVEWWRGIS